MAQSGARPEPAHHVEPMPRTSTPNPVNLPPPSARHLPRPRRGDGWDALADIEVFVFAVEAELEAMDRERIGVTVAAASRT